MAECRALVELALRDVDRFQRQKVKDLRDVFTNYAVLQAEKYKKVCLADLAVFHIYFVFLS